MSPKPLLALSLAACSLSAFATSPVGPGDLGAIDNLAVPIGNTVSGLFLDTYTFSLADPGTVSGSAFSFRLPPLYHTGLFGVVLKDDESHTLGFDLHPANGFSFAGLASGDYSLNFVGLATGALGAVYAGVISAQTMPVPEPETYAMMLAGLGAMGFMAARRRRS